MKAVQYEKLDPISHIHRRPDMYIGSTRPRLHNRIWTLHPTEIKIKEKQNVNLSEGILRLFIEVLSNAIDNAWRSESHGYKMSRIEVHYDESLQKIKIWNDGYPISQAMHEKENIPIPELIFGHLMTGSNLDDDQKRFSSGRNGLGIKLVNIFSHLFSIELVNEMHQVYQQEWKHHMRERQEPQYRQTQKRPCSTSVEWILDFSKFEVETYDVELIQYFQKLCLDASMLTGKPVRWNEMKYHCRSFSDYIRHYLPDNETEYIVFEMSLGSKRMSQFAIAKNPYKELKEISFVNGICTMEGGVHVDAFEMELFRMLLSRIQSKFSKKDSSFNIRDLKPYFMIFVNAWIENPEFGSQSKHKMTGPPMKIKLEDKWVDKLMKWGWIEQMEDLIRSRELLQLKKTEKKGGRSGGFKKIDGLDQANLAGSKKSHLCTLILCEGLSAKTFAVKGIMHGWNGYKGRDYFGIYALRGKLLNVRNATLSNIAQNREITDMIQALNLKYNVDYSKDENFHTLRYGKLMILTDADADGHHICSLIINFIHHLFPSLLRRHGFLCYMMTPVATITFRQEIDTFYNDRLYQERLSQLKANGISHYKIKYFKGLGTSSDLEIQQTFGKRVRTFMFEEIQDSECLQRIFHKLHAQDRKQWLAEYNPSQLWIQNEDTMCSISNYLNQELIQFSLEDCRRSLPNLWDGLKISQRKILYSVFKKHLTAHGKSMKVAQLAGYCAEISNYHHGEQCLFETIIKMAHSFPGSNNIPFLQQDGQFGSRTYGGKDAASARYIFTKMSELTRLLFPEEDDSLLTFAMDDGDFVEPEYYMPILPTILGNGCLAGIGTGWSCSVPSFSFLEIAHIIEQWLDGVSWDQNETLQQMLPYFHGFKGHIEKISSTKYQSSGILEKCPKRSNTWKITELPLWCWTNKYKEELETLLEQKKIQGFRNYSTSDEILFEIDMEGSPTLESLKLVNSFTISNMVLFVDGNTKLQKMESIQEIFERFCPVRLLFYQRRKDKLLHKFKVDLDTNEAQLRFLREIHDGSIDLYKKSEEWIFQELQRRNYPSDPSQSPDTCSYDYLLRLSFRDLTLQKLHQLEKTIETLRSQRDTLQNTTIQELWKHDLQSFRSIYMKKKNDGIKSYGSVHSTNGSG